MINEEQKEFIRNTIKECPAFAGNESLLEEFYDETYLHAKTLVMGKTNLDPLKLYVKRVANAAILKVLQHSSTTSSLKSSLCQKDWKLASENYAEKHISEKYISLSENQIDKIKKIVSNTKDAKTIFKKRYLESFSNADIANQMGINVLDVDKKLLVALNEIKQECF